MCAHYIYQIVFYLNYWNIYVWHLNGNVIKKNKDYVIIKLILVLIKYSYIIPLSDWKGVSYD